MDALSFKIRWESKKEAAFYCAFTFLFLAEILFGDTRIGDILSVQVVDYLSLICSLCFLVCIAIAFLQQKYGINEFITILFLIVIFFVSWYVSQATRLLTSLLIVLCTQDLNFEKFCKYAMKLIAVVVLIVSFLAIINAIDITTKVRIGNNVIITRYAMGFQHPNQLGILSFQWICCYLFVHRNRKNFVKFILCILIAFVTYAITNSITPMVLSTALTTFVLLFQYNDKYRVFTEQSIRRLIKIGILLGTVVSLYLVWFLWKNPYILVNSLRTLRGRFVLSKKYILAYGIKMFGNNIITGSSVILPGYSTPQYAFLDNGYVRLLVESGILPSISVLIAAFSYFKLLIKSNKTLLIAIFVCLCAYLFMEAKITTVYYNVFLIDIGVMLYGSRSGKGKY